MIWLIVLLLQAQLICANSSGNYRRYRNYRNSKHASPRHQTTAMTLYPRCKSDPTILDIHVLDQTGKAVGRSKLWLVSSSGMKETWTGNNGQAKVTVTGCDIGIMASIKDQKTKYQSVNLGSCTKKTEKVVIQPEKACNFLIRALGDYITTENYPYVLSKGDIFSKTDKIFYHVSTGGQSTTGSFVGGRKSSSLCISVKEGDSLYMTITSQNSEFPNILFLTNIREGTDAWITVPFPRTGVIDESSGSGVEMDFEDFTLMQILNVWSYSVESGLSISSLIPGKVFVVRPFSRASDRAFTTTSVRRDNLETGKMNLVYAKLYEGGSFQGGRLKGNTVLFDRNGNMKIIEVPDEEYITGGRGNPSAKRWVLGCMFETLDTFKETNEVVLYSDVISMSQSEVDEYCSRVLKVNVS